MSKKLIIIPTYNERENVKRMIAAIQQLELGADVLIVDDNSPDGTAKIVEDLQQESDNVHLIQRSGKLGLGTAYVEGFKFAIQHQYDLVTGKFRAIKPTISTAKMKQQACIHTDPTIRRRRDPMQEQQKSQQKTRQHKTAKPLQRSMRFSLWGKSSGKKKQPNQATTKAPSNPTNA